MPRKGPPFPFPDKVPTDKIPFDQLPVHAGNNMPFAKPDLDAFVANGTTGIPELDASQVLINDGSGTLTEAASQPPEFAQTSDVALGDLDGDGDLDAFVANPGIGPSAANQVLLNGGTGTFSEAASQPPGFDVSFAVALGDLDGDGDLDAFVANSGADQVLINDGSGSFTEAASQPPGGAQSLEVALGDLDGDGDLDAFVATFAFNQVLLNDGTGALTLAPTQPLQFASSTDVALGDLDGDGDLDAFVTNWITGVPEKDGNQVLLNNGTGTFTEASLQPPGLAFSAAVALGDLDGDGDLDAFVANAGANQVLLNDGAGTFSEASSQPPGSARSRDVALGDLDGDGDLDAFVGNEDGANQLLLNDGSGTFAEAASQPPGAVFSLAVTLGDLDGDGDHRAVDENGLPNINPDGLLPDIII